MDRNSPIDYIEKNASISMEHTKELIIYIRGMKPFGSCYQHSGSASPSLGPTSASVGTGEKEGCSNSSHLHSHSGSFGSTSGSPEMDASIARLSKTVEEMMSGSENTKKGYKESSISGRLSAGSSPNASPSQEKKNPMSGGSASSFGSPAGSPSGKTVALPTPSSSGLRHAHRTSSSSSISSSASGSSHTSASSNATSVSSAAQRQKSRSTYRDHESQLVQPILTPRFAISCTDAMLASISALLSRDPSRE